MSVEILDPAFARLVDADAKISLAGSGFVFTEGPVWHPKDNFLLFSDIPPAIRYRWDEKGSSQWLNASNKGNGLTYDRDLNLIACEHATSSVVRFTAGKREIIASHFEGKELNAPNDVVVARDGAIYFSDPTYGRMPHYGVERKQQLDFQGVYRIAPGGGAPELLVERGLFSQPNGLCFSPDEKLLYVNDTDQANIRVFDVVDGRLKHGRVFASGITDPAKPGAPDGMKCDAQGHIWLTAPAGLWVYDPAGKLIGKVVVPEFAANLAWGSADWRTLFITASTSLYTLRVKVGPHREAFMDAA